LKGKSIFKHVHFVAQDQQRNKFVDASAPTKERAPKDLAKGHHANEVSISADAALAYQDGLMDGIT